jgi:hypothetical protein
VQVVVLMLVVALVPMLVLMMGTIQHPQPC